MKSFITILTMAISLCAQAVPTVDKYYLDIEFPGRVIRDEITITKAQQGTIQGQYCYPGHFCRPMQISIYSPEVLNQLNFTFTLKEGQDSEEKIISVKLELRHGKLAGSLEMGGESFSATGGLLE